jgi:hypothetical protein
MQESGADYRAVAITGKCQPANGCTLRRVLS